MNKDGVTVTFEALEEALEDVTITVLDANNEEVEVEVLATIAKGATSATFKFVEKLTEAPTTGTWTVAGVKYDLDAIAAVKAVNEAKTQTELWAALQSPYFEGVAKQENIVSYRAGLGDGNTQYDTVEEIIKAIKALDKIEVVIEELTEAYPNEIAISTILENNFEAVVAGNTDKYVAVIYDVDGTNKVLLTSVKAIQDAIDLINLDVVVEGFGLTLITSASNFTLDIDGGSKLFELNKAKGALVALVLNDEETTDTANTLTKEELIEAIDAQLLAMDTALEAAEDNIAVANKAMADYEAAAETTDAGFKPETPAYKAVVDELKKLESKDLTENEIDAVDTALEDGENAGRNKTLIDATDAITIVDQALEALHSYKTVRGDDFDVADTNYAAVVAEFTDFAAEDYTLKNGVATMKGLVDTLNDETAEWEIYYATMNEKTKEAMEEVLYDYEVAAYTNLSVEQRFDFADRYVKKDKASLTEHSEVEADLGTAIPAYKTLIDDVNEAETNSDMQTELDKLGNTAYDALTGKSKVTATDNVLNNMPTGGYKTIADIVAAMGL